MLNITDDVIYTFLFSASIMIHVCALFSRCLLFADKRLLIIEGMIKILKQIRTTDRFIRFLRRKFLHVLHSAKILFHFLFHRVSLSLSLSLSFSLDYQIHIYIKALGKEWKGLIYFIIR